MNNLKYISKKKFFLFRFHRIRLLFIQYKNLSHFLLKYYLTNGTKKKIFFYGLQRSGTNILKAIMLDNGINICNTREYPYNSNLNRHFRFRSDSIPLSPLSGYFYRPEYLIDSLKFPDSFFDFDSSYIIAIRDFDEWIISMIGWGKRNGWFVKNEDIYDVLDELTYDYIKYCQLWEELIKNSSLDIRVFPFSSNSIKNDVHNFFGFEIDLQYYKNKSYRGSRNREKYINDQEKDFNKQIIINSINKDLYKEAKGLFEALKS